MFSLFWIEPSQAKTQIYSEQGFLSQENSLISSLRLRNIFPVELVIEPFIQLGSEVMTRGNVQHQLDKGSSYFYYGPGVSWSLFHFTALLEWRQRTFYKTADFQSSRDLRASVIYNSQWFYEILKHLSSYQEVYGEGILTSADENNTVISGWARLGLREKGFSPWNFDLYLEPFASSDTKGRFYNRRIELRPTLRAQYIFKKMYVGVTGAYVIPVSGKIMNVDFLKDRSGGVRVLAVFGGEI